MTKLQRLTTKSFFLLLISTTSCYVAFAAHAPPSCNNSQLEAIVRTEWRRCSWISKNGLCRKKKYWSHCRETCGKCNRCVDSEVNFRFRLDPDKALKTRTTCKAIAQNILYLCGNPDISATCPKTCGECGVSGAPTSQPTKQPTKQPTRQPTKQPTKTPTSHPTSR